MAPPRSGGLPPPSQTPVSWQYIAALKRSSILASIPPEWRLSDQQLTAATEQQNLTGDFFHALLGPETVAITSHDTLDLLEKMSTGKLTAVQVTMAFCHAAAVAHQVSNCLHELFVDYALDQAKMLDEEFDKDGGKTLWPLHGLPVSLKDQFHVKGVDTTMGYVGWVGGNLGLAEVEWHRKESQIVQELRGLGAVVYCKTSVPQTLFFGETVNNLIGRTINPRNRLLSCGGSSGGEGALQALRGSTVGVGTDIGGSVRIPAAFNGIFAIKPTPERVTYQHAANTNPGQTTYPSTVGFLSTSLDGLKLVLESVLSTKPWLRDPAVVPMPFRRHIYDEFVATGGGAPTRGLKLGIMWCDGVVGVHPPIMRGLKMVVEAAKKAGHKVVNWNPPSHDRANKIHTAFLFADGGHDIHKQLKKSGEPLIPDLRKNLFTPKQPLALLAYQARTLQGLDYECKYSDYWNSTTDEDGQIVDAVIMPVAPHAAVIHGKYFYTGYTEVVNLLNYSAVVIPVTKADKEKDPFNEKYRPLGELDRKNWEAYKPEVYHEAPVGVQLVGRKFEEEKMLAIAKVVCQSLGRVQERTP